MNLKLPLFTAIFLLPFGAGADSDFETNSARAEKLRTETRNQIHNQKLDIHWLKDETPLWYRNHKADGRSEIILVDTNTGERQPAFDHAKIAEHFKTEKYRLDIRALALGEEPGTLLVNIGRKGYQIDLANSKVTDHTPLSVPTPKKKGSSRPRNGQHSSTPPRTKSSDGNHQLEVREHNLFSKAQDGTDPTQLSSDGEEGNAYRASGFWSPDGKRVAVLRVREAQQHPGPHGR